MQVTVTSATDAPMDVISRAAGTCYGRDDASAKRVETCYRARHMSVFEHAYATFRIEGVSRACMVQLTRHRVASFCVESQRYCRYELSGDDWYVIPPSFQDDPAYFKARMRKAANAYSVCVAGGKKPEDARYLLPEATKTNLVMSCNVRELFHILDMRLDKAAQWEIRELAARMAQALEALGGQWEELMDMRQSC